MRVVMVTPYPSATGTAKNMSAVARYAADLVKHIALEDNDTEIIIVSEIVDEPSAETDVAVQRVFRRCAPDFDVTLFDAIVTLKPDVAHFQHELFMYGGIFSALKMPRLFFRLRQHGIAVAVTIHGVIPMADFTPRFMKVNRIRGFAWIARRVYRVLMRRIVAHSNVVIVHEERLRQLLRNDYSCNASSIEVVHMGIPALSSLPEIPDAKQLFCVAGKPTLLFFGYLAGYKGIDLLLRAIPTIQRTIPDIRLLIAGTVPARMQGSMQAEAVIAELRTLAKPSGKEAVCFLGYVPDTDVPALLRAAELLVFPYLTAMSTSYAMAQAISAGSPFIASAPFAALLGDASFYFDLTPQSIAEAVIAYFTQPQLRARVASDVRRLSATRSTSDAARRTAALYATMVPHRVA